MRATYAYETFYLRNGGGDGVLGKAVDEAVRRCIDAALFEETDSELRPAPVATAQFHEQPPSWAVFR